jgi:hypothetical protein
VGEEGVGVGGDAMEDTCLGCDCSAFAAAAHGPEEVVYLGFFWHDVFFCVFLCNSPGEKRVAALGIH